MLDCRLEDDPVNPVRIICDSRLRIPQDSRIVKTAGEIRTIVAYVTESAPEVKNSPQVRAASEMKNSPQAQEASEEIARRAEALRERGVDLIAVDADEGGHVDLKQLMKNLGEMKIDSILLEGGGELNFSAVKAGIVSLVQAYMAPKIIGGAGAKSPVGGAGIEKMADCIQLSQPEMTVFDQDILLEYSVLK